MMTKSFDSAGQFFDNLVYLPQRRTRISSQEEQMRDLELTIAGHFRDQNERQAAINNALSEKVQRLTVGIARLV